MKNLALIEAGSGAGSQNTPEGRTVALEYLQDIYNDPRQSTSVRMRAAIECLPFENPKLSAVQHQHLTKEDFATMLDRCIERSRQPTPLPRPRVIEHSPSELKTPHQRYRRY
jgi:hypothetical protein